MTTNIPIYYKNSYILDSDNTIVSVANPIITKGNDNPGEDHNIYVSITVSSGMSFLIEYDEIPSSEIHKSITSYSNYVLSNGDFFEKLSASFNSFNIGQQGKICSIEKGVAEEITNSIVFKNISDNAYTIEIGMFDKDYYYYGTNKGLIFNANEKLLFAPKIVSRYVKPSTSFNIDVDVVKQYGIYRKYTITSGTFYYKLSSASTYSSISFTGSKVNIPSTAMTGGKYDAYVSAISDDGTTASSDVVEISTIDAVGTCTPITPNSSIESGTVAFSWDYVNDYGNASTAVDIQASNDGLTWVDVASHTACTEETIVETVSLYGNIYWRVRAYNIDDVASEWSSTLSFINNVAPEFPKNIAYSGTGRKTITWDSTGQVAYQVKITGTNFEYDSSVIYGGSKSLFVNKYIPNGTYSIKVRIYGAYGTASDWGESVLNQSSNPTGSVSASITTIEGYNKINIKSSSYDKYCILRDGVVIAKTTGSEYIDRYCNGTNVYIIRGIYSDDTFEEITISVNYPCKKSCIIDGSEYYYLNENIDEKPTVSYSNNIDTSSVGYFGRKKPVHYVGTMNTKTWQIECSQKIPTGKTLFYRNRYGDSAWVYASGFNVNYNYLNIHSFSFTLEETDYAEGIDYDL